MAGQMMTFRQLAETYGISAGELPGLIEEFRDSGGRVGRFGVADGEDLPIDLFFPLETAPLCRACGQPILAGEEDALPLWLLQINEEMCPTCLSKMPVTALLKGGNLPLYIPLLIYKGQLIDVQVFLSLDSAREFLRLQSGQEDAMTKVREGAYKGSLIVTKHLKPNT